MVDTVFIELTCWFTPLRASRADSRLVRNCVDDEGARWRSFGLSRGSAGRRVFGIPRSTKVGVFFTPRLIICGGVLIAYIP